MSSREPSRKPDGGTCNGLTSAHPGGIDVPLVATCDGDRLSSAIYVPVDLFCTVLL